MNKLDTLYSRPKKEEKGKRDKPDLLLLRERALLLPDGDRERDPNKN